MKLEQAIKVAKSYNRWRTGEDERNQTDWMQQDQITLSDITKAINVLVANAETSFNEMDDGK